MIVLFIFLILMGALVWVGVTKYQNIKGFYQEVSFEMGKVTWPSREEVINSTILVGIITILMTFMIWFVDLIIMWVVRILL